MNIYWMMEQKDTGCYECKHLIPEQKDKGAPCGERYYTTEINDSNECSGRELK